MRNIKRSVLIIALSATYFAGWGQTLRQSILADGDWYELAVPADSVYKISAQMLVSMGINTSNLDPKKIQLWSNPYGILPQANATSRPIDLSQLAIYIHGESDGRLDENDYILFYGKGPDVISFDTDTGQPVYKKHYYADFTSYYLTIGDDDGKRIETSPIVPGDFPVLTSTHQTRVHEVDEENRVISGREWYERLSASEENPIGFSFPGRLLDSLVYVQSQAMAFAYSSTNISVEANALAMGAHEISAVPEGTYASKGRINLENFSGVVPASTNQDTIILNYSFQKTGTESRGYLDYVLVTASCSIGLYRGQSPFQVKPNELQTIEIANTSGSEFVWNVSDPVEVVSHEYLFNNRIQFAFASTKRSAFITIDPDQSNVAPTFLGKVENQNLQGQGPANLIIISYSGFLSEAERLANLRRTHDGLSAFVVTPEMIYHEFSSGMRDVTAIRDYIKYLYDIDHSESGIRYILFIGKGTYNFKSPLNISRNYVPIYESRNSLHPIYSYASDDFFALLEDSDGEWIETAAGDETMELGVGRLPVKSLEEARNVVDKYFSYAESPDAFGEWRNRITFVADDGDNNLHQRQANRLADTVSSKNSTLTANKIFTDAFEQQTLPATQRAEDVNKQINKSIEQGTLIMNYTGHGNERQWASERILDLPMIDGWDNKNQLPLFITATCEFGRHDNPGVVSGGEQIILKPEGGAIALVTTARPVFASQNFELNNAFYQSILASSSDGTKRLGDVFKETKNNSLAGSVNRNFSLLGDPSLRLAFPEEIITFDQINETSPAAGDTLSALEKVLVRGSVRESSGTVMANFNGIVQLNVYEKPSQKMTLGDESPSYLYDETDNIVFKGKGTVSNGSFSVEFIMPKNIELSYGNGKITAYAYDSDLNTDAGGGTNQLIIGGSAPVVAGDIEPPEISVYMEDTTFSDGMVVKPNTFLLAKFFDESGISISNSKQNLQAVIDDTTFVNLNEYYVSDLDTYQRGTVQLPINDLSQGPHKILVKAWDTHNNASEASISFIVSEKGQFVMENLRNYPNPVLSETTFTFEHNRAGDDLQVTLQIYDANGGIVKETYYDIFSAFSQVDGLEWDGRNSGGAKLRQGIYYFRVVVRSTTDGASTQQFQKLIIY